MNDYLKDAQLFLERCSTLVSDDMANQTVVDALLFFAVGIERLLKAILASLNPSFVLMDQSFKNVAPLLYKKHLAPSALFNKEFAKEPDQRVLSFRISLVRAKEFSPTTAKYYNVLMELAEARDIILHRKLSELDLQKCRQILYSQFLPIASEYAQERSISLPELIGNQIRGLEFLTKKYKGDIADKVRKKLQYYNDKWQKRKSDRNQADKLQHLAQTFNDPEAYDHAECPACGNVAVFSAQIDWDYSDGETYPVGVYPTALRCPFCGFFTKDGAEMDYLKLHEVFYEHQQQ